MGGGRGRGRSPFFDFLLHFYIVRSRAKVSTAVDISRYEWAATATIFPSSCYAVSFFDGSPAHAIYLSREGERRQRPSDRSASLNPPPPPPRGRKQHARMEEDTRFLGYIFKRGRIGSGNGPLNLREAAPREDRSFLSRIHGLFDSRPTMRRLVRGHITEIVRSGRLSRVYEERERERK